MNYSADQWRVAVDDWVKACLTLSFATIQDEGTVFDAKTNAVRLASQNLENMWKASRE